MKLLTTEAVVQDEVLKFVRDATDSTGQPIFKNYQFKPLSRTRTVLEAVARMIYRYIDTDLRAVQRAIHPHTAEERDLYEWLRRFGLEWKQATAAVHTVRIGSTKPVYFDTPIPAGSIVEIDAPARAVIKFRTLDYLLLPAGIGNDGLDYGDGQPHWTVPVRVKCLTPGVAGNVARGTIVKLSATIDGIDFVCNNLDLPDEAGYEKETPAQVRARLETAENATIAMWTPAWYRKVAETHAAVARALFVSSKDLGIPGTVKILVLGRSGELTSAEIANIITDYDSDENNPGGVAHVLVENVTPVPVEKIVTVYFPDLLSIPSEEVLQNIYQTYFASLEEGVDVLDADIRGSFYTLPRVQSVYIEPPGNVTVAAGEVGVAGLLWSVRAEVWDGI